MVGNNNQNKRESKVTKVSPLNQKDSSNTKMKLQRLNTIYKGNPGVPKPRHGSSQDQLPHNQDLLFDESEEQPNVNSALEPKVLVQS